MKKQLYHIIVNVMDKEAPYYQNFYPFGINTDEAINKVAVYLREIQQTQIQVEDCEPFDIDHLPSDVIQEDEFDGYIHPYYYGYSAEEN